ncbi:MAG: transporter [Nitrosomonadaceae bacterium]
MTPLRRIPLAMLVASLLASYGNTAVADHGSLGFGLGTASPIITGTGITLPKGTWAVGERMQFINYDTASDTKLMDLAAAGAGTPSGDVHSVSSLMSPSLFAAYGVTDRLTLGVLLPYQLRSNVRSPNEDGDAVNKLGNSSGIGDTTFFAEQNVYRSADNLSHLSLVAGVKTPTGATNINSSLGTRFEPHHQPGSGSWDPMFGMAFTQGIGRFSLDTSHMYMISTAGTRDGDGHSVVQGNVLNYNVALSYALGGSPVRSGLFASSNESRFTFVTEFNGERREHQRAGGLSDPNSASNVVYISPGIRYAGGRNWNFGVSIGTPIVHDMKGYQDPPNYRIIQRFVYVF